MYFPKYLFYRLKIQRKFLSNAKKKKKKERRPPPRCKSRTHRRRGFILESISRHRRMSHGGIVRPDEEIQHKSFPAVSLSVCLRAYAPSVRALHACGSATTTSASHARAAASVLIFLPFFSLDAPRANHLRFDLSIYVRFIPNSPTYPYNSYNYSSLLHLPFYRRKKEGI